MAGNPIHTRVRPAIRRVRGGAVARLRNAWSIGQARLSAEPPIPPRALRTRVHGGHDVSSYRATGHRCADDLLAAIGRTDVPRPHVLDFGCGSGRVLGWLASVRPDWQLSGCDIDADAVKWAAAALATIDIRQTSGTPPTSYADDSFDIVFAISVFTHLDRDAQRAWLQEWARITRPTGLILVTTHGPGAVRLDDTDAAHLASDGFVFVRDDRWREIFPDWYQTTVQTESATGQLAREAGLMVEAFRPRFVNDHQDLVSLRLDAGQ